VYVGTQKLYIEEILKSSVKRRENLKKKERERERELKQVLS